ncbi:MAG: prepilin peptidase [Patescibacteria group bacterium]|nr:prepilin peptidase [Patescibacteria group bacterium]MBU1870527.1 prepilin peptidase [Patescibacteria group bacterium]
MSTQIILIYVFVFGLAMGSFLNCLVWRLHQQKSLWKRSCCPKCKKQIAWHDNIPLLSFIILNKKCRQCGCSISWQYPVVELATGLLFVMAFVDNFQFSILTLRNFFLICVMIVIFIYDLRWYLILDIVVLPACLIIFLLNLSIGFSWQNLLISGIIGSSFFLLQFVVSRGRWIGGGDIRLGLLLGLAFGWPNILVIIFIGYLIGSLIGLGLIIFNRKKWSSQLPLGVFLSVAAIIVLFWSKEIINWYLALTLY